MEANLLIKKNWKKQKKIVVIKFIILIFFHLIASCERSNCSTNNVYNYITSFEFHKYEKGDYTQTSVFEIVISADNNNYYTLPIDSLYPLYRDFYMNEKYDFNEFVCDILSNKVILKINYIREIPIIEELIIDNQINLDIQQNGLLNVAEKHGITPNKLGNINIQPNEWSDIFLFEFYKQGYLFAFDEVDGYYKLQKADKLLNLKIQ